MTRKDTIWGARHKSEGEEISRIMEYYRANFNINVTILEASAILAERSKDTFWNEKKAREIIAKLRGLL